MGQGRGNRGQGAGEVEIASRFSTIEKDPSYSGNPWFFLVPCPLIPVPCSLSPVLCSHSTHAASGVANGVNRRIRVIRGFFRP